MASQLFLGPFHAALLCAALHAPDVVGQRTITPPAWQQDALLVGFDMGLVVRKVDVSAGGERIRGGSHTDGHMGVSGRVHMGGTFVSIGWSRQKHSVYYNIEDLGKMRSKTTIPDIYYTSLPFRIGERFPLWRHHLFAAPYLALVWSFTDAVGEWKYRGSTGVQIDNVRGDTITTSSRYTARLPERNSFTVGPGVELSFNAGRWTALAGAEYLMGSGTWLDVEVSYARASTLQGSYAETTRLRSTPAVWNLRWGLLFRLTRQKSTETTAL